MLLSVKLWHHTPGDLSSPWELQIFHTFYFCFISSFLIMTKEFSLWRVLFVMSCMLVEIYCSFRRMYCLHLQGKSVIKPSKQHTCHLFLAGCMLRLLFDPESGGVTFFWNIDVLLPDLTASHPRRYYSHSHCSENQNPARIHPWSLQTSRWWISKLTSWVTRKFMMGDCPPARLWLPIVSHSRWYPFKVNNYIHNVKEL